MAIGKDQSSAPLDVAVIGAGIGGLTAAIALRRAGHRVTVYEQSRLLSEFGAAINVPPNAYGILKRLGVDPVEKGAVEMKWFTEYNRPGTSVKVNDFTTRSKIWQHKYILAHRVDLHAQLREIATIETGVGTAVNLVTATGVTDVDIESNTITFKDESKRQADLIVGADGVHSVCRTKLTDVEPFSSGKSAYRFVLNRADVRKQQNLASIVEKDGEMAFWFGNDRDNELLNFVCIIPDPNADAEDKTWNKVGSQKDLLEAFDGFDDRALSLLRMADESSLKVWTLTDMAPVEKWHKNAFCLIGDAAHPFLPHQGQGGAQAMEDGVALGVLFPAGVERTEIADRLELFQHCRKARAEHVQAVTRQSGKDITPDHVIDANAVMKFMEYNCSYDEHDNATRLLRDWMYKGTNKVRWRMPLSFGPNQSPRQGLQGQCFDSSQSQVETLRVKFRTSRTVLQNLLPSPSFSFEGLGTFAHATYTATKLDQLEWLGGSGYNYFALFLHDVVYTKKDGSTVRGDFLPVMVENLTDPILTGREELGFPKFYSEIQIDQKSESWAMKASWKGSTYFTMDLRNVQPAEHVAPPTSDGILVYKYIPATGRPGFADAEYAVCAPSTKQTVTSFATTKECKVSVQSHDGKKLPTLHHIACGFEEIPIFEVVEGSVTEARGLDDFTSAYRIE